jgi:hypothetical protein
MPTLLLSARQTDDAQKLWRACIASDWKVERIHGWRVPAVSRTEVAVYGEPLFACHVSQTLGLNLLAPPDDWLVRVPLKYSARKVLFSTLAEARKTSERAFIKPADEKCFPAQVYNSGADLPAPGLLPESLPVLVQQVVNWQVEFRSFVLDRKVVAISPYSRNGVLAKADDGSWPAEERELVAAEEFCRSILADSELNLPDAIGLDVGIIEDHGWAVVESNAAWAAGIYGCDPAAVLPVLRRACQPR